VAPYPTPRRTPRAVTALATGSGQLRAWNVKWTTDAQARALSLGLAGMLALASVPAYAAAPINSGGSSASTFPNLSGLTTIQNCTGLEMSTQVDFNWGGQMTGVEMGGQCFTPGGNVTIEYNDSGRLFYIWHPHLGGSRARIAFGQLRQDCVAIA